MIIELFLLLLGRNILAYLMGGAFAVLSSLLHKVVSLLITYGFDLVIIIDEVGPVKLKAKGWSDEIERLVNNSSIPQPWVVRKSILKKVLRQWNIGEVMLIDISKDIVEDEINPIIEFIS